MQAMHATQGMFQLTGAKSTPLIHSVKLQCTVHAQYTKDLQSIEMPNKAACMPLPLAGVSSPRFPDRTTASHVYKDRAA